MAGFSTYSIITV